VVRELAAAALLLLALAVGALAPKFWPMDSGSALASGRPASSGPLATVASATFAPVSWKEKDGGMGYVVCGSTQNWSRPTISEQNAHLASEARYARMRADDPGSEAWTKFQAVALLYDGSALSGRIDLVALTGMWTDPYIGGNAAGCTSVEPQVWLVGYEPVSFRGSPGISQIGVRQASGYRMVVLTGAIGTDLIIVGPGGKMAAFDTRPWRGPTPTPAPKALPTSKTAASPEPPFPMTDRPLELALPGCAISPQGRHADGGGAVWTVQCGSVRANLAVSVAAVRQGWSHIAGPPIGVGMQTYAKGKLSMQLAYRLDGPAYSDPIVLVQYSRPFAQGADTSPPNLTAYLRVPTGFELPTGCVWKDGPVGFTNDGAYELGFVCAGLPAPEIRGAFHRALLAQGWRADNGGFGFINYARDDMRLTVNFVNEKAEASDSPWVVESLCCFAP